MLHSRSRSLSLITEGTQIMMIYTPDPALASTIPLLVAPENTLTTAPVAMTLATIAYADSQNINTLLANPNLATQGSWQLQWFGVNEANQAYIVQHRQNGQIAICIRGSATNPFDEDFWYDWFVEDAQVDLTDWPYGGAPTGAMLTVGTIDGLQSLLSLTNASGQSMLGCLQSLFQSSPNVLTVVTGHSLGGALAYALAPYLQQQFPTKSFWPITFAAPTAGNISFAKWLETEFAASVGRYHNLLDVVPHAWAGLVWIETSFPGGVTIPQDLADIVAAIRIVIQSNDFKQPGPGIDLQSHTLLGSTWFTEAGYQHATSTYLRLVGAPPVPNLT